MTPTLTQIRAGSTIGGECRPSRRSKAGRVCAYEGCGTVLSRYNHTDYCATHERAIADGIDDTPYLKTRDVALRMLQAAEPGEWVMRPGGIAKTTWCDAIRALKADGQPIEHRNGQGGWRLTGTKEESPEVTTDERVWGILSSHEIVAKPEDMSAGAWTGSIFRLRKRGYKIKANGAGQYRLLRPGEKLTPQDELDRRQARRKAERSTETATGTQAPQEAPVCVSEHVAVNASEVDDELLVMAGLARIAPAARRRVLEWAASRFSDEKESA